MPRRKPEPTEEQRRNVRNLSACVIESDDIAKYIGVPEKALDKYYGKDIFRARVEANAKVGKTPIEMATGGVEVAATIFYLKMRGSFHEPEEAAATPAVIPNFVMSLEKKAACSSGLTKVVGPSAFGIYRRKRSALGGRRVVRTKTHLVSKDGHIDWYSEHNQHTTERRIIAYPRRQSSAIAGNGGFAMLMAELSEAVQHKNSLARDHEVPTQSRTPPALVT